MLQEPKDSGYPIGYWAFLRDPDGHTLELSYGQEIGLTVKGSDQVIQALEQQALEWQKSEFQRLEECLLQPALRRSPQELAALLADDFIEFGSSGRIFDKSQAIAVLQHESSNQFTLTDFQIKMLAADVVLTTYQAVQQDGETGKTSISCRSSIWKSVNEQWQVIFHQGTALAAQASIKISENLEEQQGIAS